VKITFFELSKESKFKRERIKKPGKKINRTKLKICRTRGRSRIIDISVIIRKKIKNKFSGEHRSFTVEKKLSWHSIK
jgi:hypothetical protein